MYCSFMSNQSARVSYPKYANFQYPAIDDFLRNLIKFLIRAFKIRLRKSSAYFMHLPFHSENLE
ncbi:hypothetical protein T4D_1576 [Trichinella pseudospiralis]|uniref:Uncharacterized protein n=1 Tax=Trichinella pseudospiralis TaxID=6337 RepID=A0A0V1DSM4_TRIPS|nr:hypothetical protein T4D_10936 [Trichinella pseudospiralis]KRY64178.1 hypothetical protein T4D_1576 [Trichinella pseudospiralis]